MIILEVLVLIPNLIFQSEESTTLTDNTLVSLSINVFNYTWYIKLSFCGSAIIFSTTAYDNVVYLILLYGNFSLTSSRNILLFHVHTMKLLPWLVIKLTTVSLAY